MKANELMIGDWVHVEAHRGFNAQNVKVETIPDNDGDNKYGHHYGHIGTWLDGGDNDFRDVEAKHLQPIPLTPEILKKNGFTEQRGSLYVIDKREEYIGIRLYRNTMIFTHEVYCSNVEDPDELLYSQELEFENCLYVHELQHLLRLCKIDKTIEL